MAKYYDLYTGAVAPDPAFVRLWKDISVPTAPRLKEYVGGAWVSVGTKGDPGPRGSDGLNGIDGLKTSVGAGAPTSAAKVGDSYIDITSSDLWRFD